MEVGFVGLLRAAWVAAILPILVASVPCSCLNNFCQIHLLLSGRGKTLKTSSRMFTVPQKKFTHFYVVAVLSTSKLTTYNLDLCTRNNIIQGMDIVVSSFVDGSASIKTVIRVSLCIQLLSCCANACYGLFNWTLVSFYTAAPLSLCADLVPDEFKHIVRDRNQMPDVELQWWENVIPFTTLGWSQWVGAIIFLWGSIHQYCCHAILGELREGKEKAKDYIIPRGDWFELVSSPHYLAEMVIYGGIMISSGGTDLTIWLLYVFVVANLMLRKHIDGIVPSLITTRAIALQ